MKNEPWNGSTGVIGYADSKYDTINNRRKSFRIPALKISLMDVLLILFQDLSFGQLFNECMGKIW